MNILKIAAMLPSVIALIRGLEEAMPGQGRGEAKLALLRGVLEAADSTIAGAWPVLERVIGVIVGTFNKTGEFQRCDPG